MKPLSRREEILVDPLGTPVSDAQTSVFGIPTPKAGPRMVYASTLNRSDTGSVQIGPAVFIVGPDGAALVDPLGAPIGSGPVWVNRMVYADRVRQTRRLG